jgi:signal transduction histidine kinase
VEARGWLIVVSVASAAFTLMVSVTSAVSFAYRSPSLHVAVETAAALISLLAAQLMYGRFRRSLDRRDLLVTAALALFAGSNLLYSAIPAIAERSSESFGVWARALSGMLAVALLAAGAFGRARPVRRPAAAIRRAAWSCVAALVLIGVFSALAADWLPRAIEPGLSPEGGTRPRIVGNPLVLTLQLLLMGLFTAAAVGFARRAQRTGDPLTFWFAIGATLGAWARLNYFLFPSQYTDFFYTGDVLRLGFFVALLIGGAQEIRVAQRELERSAVLDERRRLAREIHDGIAQDLAFIVQQGSALADAGSSDDGQAGEIVTAARRALDESRGAIAALVRPTDEPLSVAIERVAEDAAGRWGATLDTDVVRGLEVPAQTREALLRIVGEAVSNAARHGRADHVRLSLRSDPHLELVIGDDGVGFDPASLAHRSGRHGIASMRERAEALGGELRIASRPGEGTRVVVVLP